MPRSMPYLTLFAVSALACLPAAAGAAEPAVAPPATPRVAAACEQRSAAAEATKDEVTVVPRGDVGLTGCVSDESGIEAVLVRWSSKDGDEHGRICTDPAVLAGQWTCTWDAGRLPVGEYELELVAVDAAGNRGSSSRRYRLTDRPADPPPPDLGGSDAPAATPEPSPERVDPTSPAEPPVEGSATPDATPSTAPDADAGSQPIEPQPTEPPTSTAPLLEPDAQVQVFSAVQHLVIDQVVACERGGSDTRPTDEIGVTGEREQAELVLACLRPALELAGADPIELRATAPEPFAVVATVASSGVRVDIDAVLPDVVAGVPVVVTAPELDVDDAAYVEPVPGALIPDAG